MVCICICVSMGCDLLLPVCPAYFKVCVEVDVMLNNPGLFVCKQVKNTEQKWFVLKDKKLLCRAKGAILLELDVIYNPVGIILSCYM